jgi:hypothetical protein
VLKEDACHVGGVRAEHRLELGRCHERRVHHPVEAEVILRRVVDGVLRIDGVLLSGHVFVGDFGDVADLGALPQRPHNELDPCSVVVPRAVRLPLPPTKVAQVLLRDGDRHLGRLIL